MELHCKNCGNTEEFVTSVPVHGEETALVSGSGEFIAWVDDGEADLLEAMDEWDHENSDISCPKCGSEDVVNMEAPQ